MKLGTMAWVVGGVLVVAAGGAGVAACSSSSGSPANPGTDSGAGTDTGGGGQDANMPMDDAGTGADCGKNPTLHPSDGGKGSIFCAYPNDGGKAIYCDSPTQECCLGGFIGNNMYDDNTCQAVGTPCTNGAPLDGGGTNADQIPCEVSADCPGGSICCATGDTPAMSVPGCTYYKGGHFFGTSCVQGTTCQAGQFQLCGDSNECAGKTCTPFKAKILSLGFCL
jgi:hypothetical protein